jgi:vesicle transport through interaction with t-SNAREs protein 1
LSQRLRLTSFYVQIRRMDLEARSLPPTQKATLLAKLREYKSDLTNLKRDVKKSASTDAASARDDLLESGMADHANVSTSVIFIHKDADLF